MTFSCWWGVSRSALIHESTSLPCVTDLSMSPGLAQGEVCQAYLVLAMGHLSHALGLCVCVLQPNGYSVNVHVCEWRKHTFHNACSLKVSSCKQHYALCIYLCRIIGCYFSVSLKYMCAPRWRFIAAFLTHTNTNISSHSLRHAYTQETTCSGM